MKKLATTPKDFRAALVVKVKSLADESRIIRKEEKKCRTYDEQRKLSHHRRDVVRWHARCAHLALAFIRGKDYDQVENKTPLSTNGGWFYNHERNKIIDAVAKMIYSYGVFRSYHYSPSSQEIESTKVIVNAWLKGEKLPIG